MIFNLSDIVFLGRIAPQTGPVFTVSIAEAANVLTATVSEASATGTAIYSYDWRRDGVSLGVADATTYDTTGTAGVYSVRVTGTDDTGARAVISNAVTVGAAAPAGFSDGFSNGFEVAA